MITNLLWVCLSLVLLYFGGEQLVKGAVCLGKRAGMSTLVVGLTLVAFGTSAPELAVSLDAALTDHQDIAVANILGSNLANLGLVAGITALFGYIALGRDMTRTDLPVMVFSMLLLVGFLWDQALTRLEGSILLSTLVAYVIYRIMKPGHAEPEALPETRSTALPRAFVSAVVGLVLLGLGGDLLVDNAAQLAAGLGVTEAFIGFTVIAIGTSLPEIATSIAAVRLNHGAVAIGNIIGSNIWNSLGVLGITAAVAPLQTIDITWHLMVAMLAIALLVMALSLTTGRINRVWGITFLISYFGYLIYAM